MTGPVPSQERAAGGEVAGPVRCDMIDGLGPCEQMAVVHVIAGCLHEHVRDGNLCQRDADRTMLCGTCFGGPRHHECALRTVSTRPLVTS